MSTKPNTSSSTKSQSEQYDAPEGWGKALTGFPPYVKNEEGMKFQGVVFEKDDSNEEFIRYVMQATKPVTAYRGPKDNAEKVTVKPGEYFTVSPAVNLNLDGFIGKEVFVKCTGKIKAKTPAGFVWGFDVHVNPVAPEALPEGRGGAQQLGN